MLWGFGPLSTPWSLASLKRPSWFSSKIHWPALLHWLLFLNPSLKYWSSSCSHPLFSLLSTGLSSLVPPICPGFQLLPAYLYAEPPASPELHDCLFHLSSVSLVGWFRESSTNHAQNSTPPTPPFQSNLFPSLVNGVAICLVVRVLGTSASALTSESSLLGLRVLSLYILRTLWTNSCFSNTSSPALQQVLVLTCVNTTPVLAQQPPKRFLGLHYLVFETIAPIATEVFLGKQGILLFAKFPWLHMDDKLSFHDQAALAYLSNLSFENLLLLVAINRP